MHGQNHIKLILSTYMGSDGRMFVVYHRPATNQIQLTALLRTTVAQVQDIDTFLTTHFCSIRIKIEGKEKK